MAAHYVICPYCGIKFNRDITPFQKINERRYAHVDCYIAYQNSRSQEEIDAENLENYIKELFELKSLTPGIYKQLKTFAQEQGYTSKGMLQALKYFYEVKKGDITKANKRIGIIPYVYDEARQYYYAIWEANQNNKVKIQEHQPQYETVEVHIPSPERKTDRKKKFTFLDSEEVFVYEF